MLELRSGKNRIGLPSKGQQLPDAAQQTNTTNNSSIYSLSAAPQRHQTQVSFGLTSQTQKKYIYIQSLQVQLSHLPKTERIENSHGKQVSSQNSSLAQLLRALEQLYYTILDYTTTDRDSCSNHSNRATKPNQIDSVPCQPSKSVRGDQQQQNCRTHTRREGFADTQTGMLPGKSRKRNVRSIF